MSESNLLRKTVDKVSVGSKTDKEFISLAEEVIRKISVEEEKEAREGDVKNGQAG